MNRFILFLLAPGDALFKKKPSWKYIFNIFFFILVITSVGILTWYFALKTTSRNLFIFLITLPFLLRYLWQSASGIRNRYIYPERFLASEKGGDANFFGILYAIGFALVVLILVYFIFIYGH